MTGLHECLDRTDKRNGGWHKGRFRIQSVPLERSSEVFEETRTAYQNAAVVAGLPQRYMTECV